MVYEDFTTFTEVDEAADRIQKTANHIDHLAYRNETTYLYKDYGADHFGDFTHKIKVKAVSASATTAFGAVWALADQLGNISWLKTNNYVSIDVEFQRQDSACVVILRENHNGSEYYDYWAGASWDTWYYIKIVKSGTSLNAYIYSDSDYSTLVDTLTLTLQADHTLKYLYGCNTYDDDTTPYLTADIENFDIGETVQYTKTFTADALIEAEKTKTFTADTLIEATQTKTFTADTIIVNRNTKIFTADVQLKAPITRTFTCDTILVNHATKTFTADAILSSSISGITRDGASNILGNCTVWLFKSSDKSFIEETTSNVSGEYSFDGLLAGISYFIRAFKNGSPNIFGTTDDDLEAKSETDIYLYEGHTTPEDIILHYAGEPSEQKSFIVDVILVHRYLETFTCAVILKRTTTKTFSIDAIVGVNLKIFAADSVLYKTTTKTYSANALLRYVYTKTFTANAMLTAVATKTYSINAVLLSTKTKAFTANAVLRNVSTKAYSVDGILVNKLTKPFSSGALLLYTDTKTFTGDALLQRTIIRTGKSGTSNYAGYTGVTITHNFNLADYVAFITSTADADASVGETYIDSIIPNSFTIHNSGYGQSEFRWIVPNNPYDDGNSTFAGTGGQTVTHTKGDTDYVPCIIPSADGNGAIGKWWVTDIANTSFVVRNSGSGITAFEWAIPRFGTGGKGASSFAGPNGVTVTHNLNISGDYTPFVIPTEDPDGQLGAVYVTDILTNSFKVKNTGSATTTFSWVISDKGGLSVDAFLVNVFTKTYTSAAFLKQTFTKTFISDVFLSALQTKTFSVSATTIRVKQFTVDAFIGDVFAPTRGFYYSKLGTDNFINPPDEDFNVTVEHNGIASFDFVIQNNATNRTIIADHLTEDFKIMRDDGTEILTGSIDSDRIEYFAEGEGGAGKRIRLSGYASFIDLAYLIYKRMADADAEATGSVQDEDNSTATFTDYTTQANNDTINDVILTFGATNDALYIGEDNTGFALKMKYSTKGIQAANTTIVIEYSKGSGVWATLDCIDESYAFTEDAGTYLFYMPNKPDDWGKNTVNGKKKYWIRFRITQGSYTTLPKLDRIWASNTDVCRVQFNDVAANTILGYVLAGTGYSEDATDQCPADAITIRGEYDSKLRWIFGIGSALTWEDGNGDKQRYDVWIDTSKKTHFKQQRGSDKGDLSGDFRTVNNKMGYHGIGTRIFGAGGYDGVNQKRAIVEDTTAQATHKLREIVLEDSRITGYEALKAETQKSLTIRKAPLKEVSGDIDTKYLLDNSLSVGDMITINQPDWNLNDQELYIMRAVIDPSNTHLDLGTSQMHLEHMRSSLQRQMDINNVWMHGATNIYQLGPAADNFERVNATTVYPLEMSVQTPSDVRAINKVEISWRLSNYKSSVKPSSSSGGGHNHSHGGSGVEGGHDHLGSSDLDGGHIHAIGGYDHGTLSASACGEWNWVVKDLNLGSTCELGWCISSYTYVQAPTLNHMHNVPVGAHAHSESTEPHHWHVVGTDTEPNHAHSVPDSNTEPDHEHTTDYGVHEEAGGTTLELYINDVLVANNYVGDQENINITGWVSKGTNTVKLQPIVGDNVKGRAEMVGIAHVFIESK